MLAEEPAHTLHVLAYEPDEPDNDANSRKRAANNNDTADVAADGVRSERRRENEPKNPRQII